MYEADRWAITESADGSSGILEADMRCAVLAVHTELTNWLFWMKVHIINRPPVTWELVQDSSTYSIPNIHKPGQWNKTLVVVCVDIHTRSHTHQTYEQKYIRPPTVLEVAQTLIVCVCTHSHTHTHSLDIHKQTYTCVCTHTCANHSHT